MIEIGWLRRDAIRIIQEFLSQKKQMTSELLPEFLDWNTDLISSQLRLQKEIKNLSIS